MPQTPTRASAAASSTARGNSADVILQLLDHLRGMAQLDGHPDMAGILEDAYDRCLRLEAAHRQSSGDPSRLQ